MGRAECAGEIGDPEACPDQDEGDHDGCEVAPQQRRAAAVATAGVLRHGAIFAAAPIIGKNAGPMRAPILEGIGAYRPHRVVDNAEVCQWLDSTDEWIRERSGIRTRRWASPEETHAMMGTAAAREALERAGLEPEDLDMVMVATCTSTQPIWPVAHQVSASLGIEPAAMDLNVTCAGFCYGLGLARDLIRGGTVDHVLVIGVERLSDITDRTDRGTAFIFADGAGAVVIGSGSETGVGPPVWGSSAKRGETLLLSPSYAEFIADKDLGKPSIRMQGRRVFHWAGETIPSVARAAVEAAGMQMGDIDVFVPHQANQRITDLLVRSLGLDDDVVVGQDIVDSGNTSSASIPLAVHRLLADGKAHSGDVALLIGFGGGLSFCGQVVVLP